MHIIWQLSFVYLSFLLLLKICDNSKFESSQICAEENLPSEQTDMKQLGPTKVVLFVSTAVY